MLKLKLKDQKRIKDEYTKEEKEDFNQVGMSEWIPSFKGVRRRELR